MSSELPFPPQLPSILHVPVSGPPFHQRNSYSPRRNPTSPSCPRGLSRPVGRSVGLSVRRSVGLSVCRSVGLSVHRSVGQSVCRSVGQSVCRSVGPSVSRSVGQSVCRSVGFSAFSVSAFRRLKAVSFWIQFCILGDPNMGSFGSHFGDLGGPLGVQGVLLGVILRVLGHPWTSILGSWGGLGLPFWSSGVPLGAFAAQSPSKSP